MGERQERERSKGERDIEKRGTEEINKLRYT